MQDAFLLRSHFLAVPARHALRLICPHLDIVYEPSADELQVQKIGDKPASSVPVSRVEEESSGSGSSTPSPEKESMATAVLAHPPPSFPPPVYPPPSYPPPPPINPAMSAPSPFIYKTSSAVPDSLWLLPGSIIIIDMGSRLLLWNGGPLLDNLNKELECASSNSKSPEKSVPTANDNALVKLREASLKRAHSICIERSHQRRPVAEVITLRGGSPEERLAFSTLSPSHMDRPEVISATMQHFGDAKWSPYLRSVIERSPHTDQQSFAMFLVRVSPSHGNEWCRMGSFIPLTEEHRRLKAVQPVPMMDRGIMFGPGMDIIDVL